MLEGIFSQIAIHPQLVLVVPALLILGYALKNTPKVQDWMIIWILLLLGIMASILKLGFTVNGIANGMIAAGAAITTHQAIKQSFRSHRKKKR
ncbi:phage holin family protein [Cytobacillus sp. S13-E01]|uniref:phage holin family protein n=1 Tax=Cytobacillus sp. S13-E01 TaxID=3031326 RepID=UPI0023D8C47F|nr:phage holin family protein [Cytobacillus sp. S13-E01]MDF0726274.1 phage holin family protein [Cytobacillus sp. S13-E01]